MPTVNLSLKAMAILVGLSLVWGANMAMVKLGLLEMTPMFMTLVRSVVASLCLYAWMKYKGLPLFHSRRLTYFGCGLGFLFGLEFAVIYTGLSMNAVSRTYIMVYCAPFFAALGGHYWLKDDRLTWFKSVGLILAFSGVAILISRDGGNGGESSLVGDMLTLFGGFLWAATTLYVKRYMTHETQPVHTLFYQQFFSIPFLLIASLIFEDNWVTGMSGLTLFSLFYQCIIVAFVSYLIWFNLVHAYPASLLHAFSFFTPIFGVLISGALIMGEPLTYHLMAALILVCVGMVLVNRPADGWRR